jgi:hypothetical protein
MMFFDWMLHKSSIFNLEYMYLLIDLSFILLNSLIAQRQVTPYDEF